MSGSTFRTLAAPVIAEARPFTATSSFKPDSSSFPVACLVSALWLSRSGFLFPPAPGPPVAKKTRSAGA